MKIALLISGGGSTMEAIMKACQNNVLKNVEPVLVVSSNKNAGGIQKAFRFCEEKSKKFRITKKDILVINPRDFLNKEEFGKKIIEECKKREVDFVGQYGWMVKTPNNLINEYKNMIINQHPGPLDTGKLDFGGVGMFGMRVHCARLEFVRKIKRDFWTEATAHRVTENFDEGIILKRKQVPILEDDTVETLQKRVLPVEHEIQIELLKDFSEGKVNEFHREMPLVLQSEGKILEECKEIAKKMYPNG